MNLSIFPGRRTFWDMGTRSHHYLAIIITIRVGRLCLVPTKILTFVAWINSCQAGFYNNRLLENLVFQKDILAMKRISTYLNLHNYALSLTKVKVRPSFIMPLGKILEKQPTNFCLTAAWIRKHLGWNLGNV